MAKRKKLADIMREKLEQQAKKPVENPLLDALTEPRNLIGGREEDHHPRRPGEDPLAWIKEKYRRRAEWEGWQRQKEQEKYTGKMVSLPDIVTEEGKRRSGHLWFRSYTPDRVIEALKNDPEMLTWAAQWSAPGGNVYAEIMFWNKYYEMFDVLDNPNLKHKDLDYEDSRHFFDWMKWKQEYNELHHGIMTTIRGNR